MQTIKEHKEETLKDFSDEFGIHFKNSAGELQFAQAFIAEALDKQIEIVKELLPDERVSYVKERDKISFENFVFYSQGYSDYLFKVKEILK